MSYTLSAISFIMLIAVPILTMRSMAEERHSRTDQLVLTAPVSLGKMIFGKFLAMVGVFTVAVAVIAVTPLVLAAFGTVPMLSLIHISNIQQEEMLTFFSNEYSICIST